MGSKWNQQVYAFYRTDKLHFRLCHLCIDVVCFQSEHPRTAKPFPNGLVRRKSFITNPDSPHDSYPQNTIYPELGNGTGTGTHHYHHGNRGNYSVHTICRCLKDGAASNEFLPLANRDSHRILFPHTNCEELVHQEIQSVGVG